MVHVVFGLVDPNVDSLICEETYVGAGIEGLVVVGEYADFDPTVVGRSNGSGQFVVADGEHAQIQACLGALQFAQD